ncbi:MAG: hypothetical protein ACOCQR_03730 [bacterium]
MNLEIFFQKYKFPFNYILIDKLNKHYSKYNKLIEEKYFFEPGGIHGVNHAHRVLFLCTLLCSLCSMSISDYKLLALVAVYHDIGRTHNGSCTEHGQWSFLKVSNLNLIKNESKFLINYLKYIMINHCVDDLIAYQELNNYCFPDKEHAFKLLKLFKDADALDRVRTRDLDISYLRYEESKKLIPIAEDLILKF